MVPHPRDQHLDPEYPEVAKIFYLDPPLIVENDEKVKVMVLLLSHTNENHLKVLAELVRHFRQGQFRELLERGSSIEDLLANLNS